MTTGDRRPANAPPSTPPNATSRALSPGQPARGPSRTADPRRGSQGREVPLVLLAVSPDDGTVLAAWRVPATGPRDLVGRVAETQGILTDDYRTDDAADPQYQRDPAGFLVLPRDPASPTGQRLAEAYEAGQQITAANLLARIKAVEEADGSWPGGYVVQVLTDWFTSLGLDIEVAPAPAVTLAPPGATSRFYTVDEEDPDAPRLVIEYHGPHHGRVRPGDRVVYENPAWRRSDGSYFTCGLDGPLTVTEIIDLGGGHPPQAILADGEFEVSADNLRALPEEASDDA